jgi:hypothetical protein
VDFLALLDGVFLPACSSTFSSGFSSWGWGIFFFIFFKKIYLLYIKKLIYQLMRSEFIENGKYILCHFWLCSFVLFYSFIFRW